MIGALILRCAQDLFRREVSWRPLHALGSGNLRGQLRDSKVAQLYLLLWSYKNVSGLNVAVDDSRAMREGEGASNIRGPGAGALQG